MNSWKKQFYKLMISQGISMLGSLIVSSAMIWYVTLQTNSGVAIAGVTITTFVPQMLLLLPGGILADRYEPKKIIALSDSFIALSTLVLAVFFYMGLDSIGWLLFFNTLRSFGAGIQMPAIRSILPMTIPEEELMKANGLYTGLWSVNSLISPGLAGLLLSITAVQNVFLVDVITAAIGVGLLLTIKMYNHFEREDIQKPWEELKLGVQYVLKEKRIKNCILFYAAFQFLIVPASQLTPLLASRNIGQHIWVLSVLETAFSVGALIASTVMACKEIKVREFVLIGCSAMVFGTTMILLLLTNNVVIFMVLMLIMGIGSPLYYTPLTTYIQENTKEIYMGRVFSYVELFSTLGISLGMALFGPLANLGVWISFLFPGLGMLLLGLGAIRAKQ